MTEAGINYFPFHMGDFAAHTSHLTWEEDIAYRRMLDVYYLHEKALPTDSSKIARLIRMPESAGVIGAVLDEFFVLSVDGWHNKRADEELTAMRAKQEQQSSKDAHESERMRRYRERRAEMFAALRQREIVPAWDVPVKELQRLFEQTCNGPATDMQREQAQTCNAAATAIPIPTPTPTPKNKEEKTAAVASRSKKPRTALPEDFAPNEAGVKAANSGGIDIDRELGQFRNRHVATGSVMADWQAAWRTWVGNAVQYGRGGKAKPTQASWASAAGFDSVYEAENAGCRQHNAHLFRAGKRMELLS